ncbi:type II toxin-antitoxin system ParD family antitoxin [Sphingomonas sp. Leaf357]|uniref:type II toxin-antitoxin system ParD family antitoxin n=1 Tax=Sphingomonas sp. Leaf357 TaxID=1736350 RepID=UPI001EFFA1FC|nr:type II toxin-antitoxin system ParD family antitoxin [Sphingomonas sp. Leaf357]
MNISLPEPLKAFVDEQVAERDFGTSSEYIRELIRNERDREALRRLLMEGANSPPSVVADAQYFEGLKARIRNRAKK